MVKLQKVDVIFGKKIYYDKSAVQLAEENGCEVQWPVLVLDMPIREGKCPLSPDAEEGKSHWENYAAKMKADGHDGGLADVIILENTAPMTPKEVCDEIKKLGLGRGRYEHLVAAAGHYPTGHAVALGTEMTFADAGMFAKLPSDPVANFTQGKLRRKKYVFGLNIIDGGRQVLTLDEIDAENFGAEDSGKDSIVRWPAGTYFVAVAASLEE